MLLFLYDKLSSLYLLQTRLFDILFEILQAPIITETDLFKILIKEVHD
jgi:hypothetical protein